MSRVASMVASSILILAACTRPHSDVQTHQTPTASRDSVFSDSLVHARLCEVPKRGEDWHQVCTPRSQGLPRKP
jgi:hypothetical protein